MNLCDVLALLHQVIALLFFVCYAHQLVYLLIPRKKAKPPTELSGRRYAVLIAARNEEEVLPELIASILSQDYPRELIDVYVVADNCTDRTAEVARAAGATVHERFNNVQIGKGYALAELLEVCSPNCDSYLIFDADNLLAPDFVRQIDRTFAEGYTIVTAYRNAKNFGDNWISSSYGLWFLREASQLSRPRMQLGLCCTVSGTGFGFTREVLERTEGWRYVSLSEDTEFSVDRLLAGERIGYCDDAIFYDEQPTEFAQSWRQRMRWAKGYFLVFRQYGGRLLRTVLTAHPRLAFSCYDLCMTILPAMLLNFAAILGDILLLTAALIGEQPILPMLTIILSALPGAYLSFAALGAVTTFTEWRRIEASTMRKLSAVLTFPLFMLTYIPIAVAALFCRVEWKPIRHRARSLNRH